jgi:hypothetical protein
LVGKPQRESPHGRPKYKRRIMLRKVGPCHHSMLQPLAVDGEYNLQISKVVANIFNKQSRPTRHGPQAWGFVGS